MGLFSFLQTKDINSGVRSFLSTEGAVLLDVRTPEEYAEGHIVGSKNIPLQSIEKTESVITDKSTPLFVHCRSGARSAPPVPSPSLNSALIIGFCPQYSRSPFPAGSFEQWLASIYSLQIGCIP